MNYAQVTWLVVAEVWSTSFGLLLHAQHILQILLIFSSLRVTATGCSFPFHVHILCIRYDTVLANTAVLCMRVHSICLPARGAPCECYYNTVLCCKDYFWSSSVVSHTFSVLCVYSKFGHHPHPLGYLCAKICFFCGLHCWASPRRKIAYSITQSPSLFDAPGTEACAL